MIIDAHVHIGREELFSPSMVEFMNSHHLLDEAGRRRLLPEGLIEEMDSNNIDKAIVFPLAFPENAEQLNILNEFTINSVSKYSKRLIGFAVIAPSDIAASIKLLEQVIKEDQLRGIKIHPSMQRVFMNDPLLDPIYEFATQADIPILFHSGAGPSGQSDKYSQPSLIEDVLIKHKGLKVILAHMGRPFYEETAYILRKYGNVFADISANKGRKGGPALLRHVLMFLHTYAGAAERLIFGTDYPVFTFHDYLNQVHTALEGGMFGGEKIDFTQDEIEGILGKNILRLINEKE